MVKLSDFGGLRNKATIKLVRKEQFEDDQYVFEFDADGMVWRPGEHGIFSIPDKKVDSKKWRAFSVASTPDEGVLRIATKITDTPSSFKANLRDLKPGDKVTVRGPFGWFYRQDDHTPIVMVAVGVGITPIMAMVEQHGNDPTSASMHVIYVARVRHLFKEKLNKAVKKNPNISVDFVKDSKTANKLLDKQIAGHGKHAYYYLSGAPSVVKALNKKLKNTDIPRSRIIYDSYMGY